MRSKGIEITLSIPVPVNEPDGNGNIYTEEAVIKACENAGGQPIIQYGENGEDVVIGIANKVEYSNGFIWVEGAVFYGGTGESIPNGGMVLLDKGVKISNMEITHFGFNR